MPTAATSAVETWLPVVGWEGLYEVSDHGRVRSLDRFVGARGGGVALRRGRIRKPAVDDESGYSYVTLNDGTRRARRTVHSIVLEAFVGPRPDGHESCHNDSAHPLRNTLDNLRYDTIPENRRDTIRHGNNRNVNKTHCPKNHPYTAANTYVTKEGWRQCRKCRGDAKARFEARHAA